MQTQAETLQQDALIEQVVKKLRLDEQPEFQRGISVWEKFRRRGGPGPGSVPNLQNAVETVKKNVNIVPSRTSRIIRIAYDSRDAQLAADVANTLAQTFIQQGIDVKQRAAQQTQKSLSLQLEVLKSNLLRSEAELAARGSREPSATSINPTTRSIWSWRPTAGFTRRCCSGSMTRASPRPSPNPISALSARPGRRRIPTNRICHSIWRSGCSAG